MKSCFPGLSSPALTTSSAICISKSVAKCEALGLLRACWVAAGCLPGASLNLYFVYPSGSAPSPPPPPPASRMSPGCFLGASWVLPGRLPGASLNHYRLPALLPPLLLLPPECLLGASWVGPGCLPGASLNLYFVRPLGSRPPSPPFSTLVVLLGTWCILGASWVPP